MAGFSQGISNKGKEFWVGYGHHQYMEPPCSGTGSAPNDMNMVIYLSAEEAATVVLTIDSSGPVSSSWFRKTYVIPANTVISTENLPKGIVDAANSASNTNFDARLITDPPPAGTGGEGIFRKKGIHIESSVPIVAYAHIYGGVSSGATMLLPTETWGFAYTSMNSEQRNADRSYSWMYVVAKENNTRVIITPSAASRLGKPAGVPFTVDLQKGQIYQLIGNAQCTTGDGAELTGTTVVSIPGPDGICHAVAVFSGSSRTGGETFTCGTGSGRDNDMQQCFPEQTWGKRYLTAPFSSATGSTPQPSTFMTSVFKVLVQDPNTQVFRNGVRLTGLIGGKYYKFSSNRTDYIEADKPIMVAQFMSGASACSGGSQGDPEMIYLSPIEQAKSKVGLYRNNKQLITVNYVTLIVPTAAVPSLRIDGSGVFSHTYAHTKAGYTVVIKGYNATPPAQCIISCDSALNGITYGLGGAESYGYNIGTFFNTLTAIADFHNIPDTSNYSYAHPIGFVGTPMELGALFSYKPTRIIWKLSALGTNVNPNADVTVNNPIPLDSLLIGSAWYYRYRLPGTYTFNRPDTFIIPVKLTSPIQGSATSCLNEETAYINVIIRPKPQATFTYSVRGCGRDTVFFSAPDSIPGFKVLKWRWLFPNGDTSNIRTPQYLFDTGSYQVKLTLTVKDGGLADTTMTIVIPPKPIANFGATPAAFCIGQQVTLTDSTIYTGTAPILNWHWDLGDGQIRNNPNGNGFTYTYATPGTFIIKHAVRISDFCKSDTVRKTIRVLPGAVLGFTYPLGCLPPSGIAQFRADSVDVGGQRIVSYLWNFGDSANSTPTNPNSSTLQNPAHIYSGIGSYTVRLRVVTATGCSGDTSVVISMNVQPTTVFTRIDSVCANSPVVSIANASVTNNVPGRGKYYGAGTDTLGNFNPAIAGPGTHLIYWVYISNGGCIDTARQYVTVNPVPAKPVVVSPVAYCQNAVATPLSATALSGNTLTWFTTPALTSGTATAPTPVTTASGTTFYYVNQTSIFGCKGDTARVTVEITPTITGNTVGIDQTLCSSGASADTLRPQASIAGGIGVYTYQWQQSSDGGVTFSNITGATAASYFPGSVNGARKFRRVVASGLCTATSNVVTVTIVAGLTNFDISANQSICAGTVPTLLDGQTATGGGTISYQWQVSTDSTTWVTITGATAEDYQPPLLDSTRFYRRVISNSVCTANSSVVKIKVTAIANGTISGATTICSYDTAAVMFTATAGTAPFSVQLTITLPGGGTRTINQIIPTAGPTSITVVPVNSTAGTYSIAITRLSDSNGCVRTTGFTAVSIQVNAKPTLTISSAVAICRGGSTTLNAGGADIYTWTPSVGLSATNLSSVVANPANTTTYWVNGTTNACKADSVSVTVTVNPLPVKPATTNLITYCQNAVAAPLSAIAITGNIIKWYTNSALTGGSAIAPTPSTAASGAFLYYVTQTNSNNCESDTATITVVVQPTISGNTISADQTLCSAGAAAALVSAATVVGGSGSYTFQWSRSLDGGATWNAIGGATAASFNPGTLTANTQFRRAINSGQCSSVSNVVAITVLAPFTGATISANQTVCEGVTPALITGQTASAGSGTIVYQWQSSPTGASYTSIAGATSKDYQPPVITTATYYRRVVNNSTCSDTSNVVLVRVNVKPTGNIAAPISICVYEPADVVYNPMIGIAPFTVVLAVTDPGGAVTNRTQVVNAVPTNINVIAANSAPGNYDVVVSRVTDNNGCLNNTGFSPATIIVYPKPVVTASRAVAICNGDSTTLTVSGASTYTWTPIAGLDSTTGSTVSAKPNTTTTYTITGNANGCVADPVSITVTVNPVPSKPTVVRPVIYCQDATPMPLSATAATGNSLSWFTSPSLIGANAVTPTPSTATVGTTSYYVRQTSAFGCVSDTSTIAVFVNPLPSVDFRFPASACMDINGQTTISFSNQSSVPGGGIFSSNWNFGDASSSTDKDPVHPYTTPGPHQVTLSVSSAQGCTTQLVKTLPAFLRKPAVNFTVNPDTLCQGTPSVFTDYSSAQGSTIQTWNWSFGDGSTSTQKDPIKNYQLPGTYRVRLTVLNAQGCQGDSSYVVKVYLQPVIDAGPSFVVPQGTLLQFVPKVKDSTNLTYQWTPATSLSNATDLRPTTVAQSDIIYKLTATGEGQCSASDTLYVKVLMPLRIPNAFSPNGDGVNDTWQIPNLKDYPGATVEVFNRYGQSMFRSIGYALPWSGTYKGNALPVGTYYYIIELKNGFNQVSGSITLLK